MNIFYLTVNNINGWFKWKEIIKIQKWIQIVIAQIIKWTLILILLVQATLDQIIIMI